MKGDMRIAWAVAELRLCPELNDRQREKGSTCARYANGGECFAGGECAEAEGGRWIITDTRIGPVPDEPFASDGYWWEVPGEAQ